MESYPGTDNRSLGNLRVYICLVTCDVNRLIKGQGRCNYLLHPTCACGEEDQTMEDIIHCSPIFSYQGLPNDLFDLPARTVTWLENLDIDL
ncbi:jg17358 [Pararge aegeria aegeria]|uniref:Jg17358 protein n=1 Tax=Pararge aegeria aegeria TaxID=348720 RepID=A0A8S4RPT1_9NEOP|nr:jg17358 [Pararge aegeria aegeria]